MEATSPATMATFVVYIVLTFVLAAVSHRLLTKKSFLGEYFLGSRTLGSWALAFTFAATSASGGSFTGFPALIYAHGWILALWIASYMIVPLCTMGVLGKRLNQVARKTGAITIPDVLRDRYEATGLGLLATCTIIFFTTSNLVAQFRAGSIILQKTFNLPTGDSIIPTIEDGYLIGLLVFAVVVVFYTAYGGFRAVVWTDVMQGMVMGAGVVIMLPLVLSKAGGLAGATDHFREQPPFLVTALAGKNNDLAFILKDDLPEEEIPRGIRFRIDRDQKEKVTVVIRDDGQARRWIEIGLALNGADVPQATAAEIAQAVRNAPQAASLFAEVKNAYENDGTGTWNWESEQGGTAGEKQWVFLRGESFLFGPGRTPSGAPFHTLGMVISFFFMWAISGMGQPGTMVRLMAFKESRTLKRAIMTVTVYFSLIYLPLVFIFVAARNTHLRYLSPENFDSAMALVATRVVSTDFISSIVAAILVAAPFAAVMSTVDSFLLITSSGIVRDIYQRTVNPNVGERTVKWMSYTVTAVVGVIVSVLALRKIEFLQNIIVFTGAGFASTFLAPMFLGLYWKRMTKWGAYASMIGGFSTIAICFWPTLFHGDRINPFGFHPVFWGLGLSFLLGVVASMVTPRPPEHIIRKYFLTQKSK